MTDEERWLPVINYEGLYEVSSFGRVRSLERMVASSKGAAKQRRVPTKILSPSVVDGYLHLAVCREGKAESVSVHIMVAESFIGPRPEGFDTDHIDFNRANPRLDNLQYIPHRANVVRSPYIQARMTDPVLVKEIIARFPNEWAQIADATGTWAKAARHRMRNRVRALTAPPRPKTKLTEDQVRAILADTRPHTDIAAAYQCGRRTIGAIKYGESWKHISQQPGLTPSRGERG